MIECPRCGGLGVLLANWHPEVCSWEEQALAVLDSLVNHDLSAKLASDWLKTILDYAEAR